MTDEIMNLRSFVEKTPAVQRARYMALQTIAPIEDDPLVSLPALARLRPCRRYGDHAVSYTTSGDMITPPPQITALKP